MPVDDVRVQEEQPLDQMMMLDYKRNNHCTSRLCKSTRGTTIRSDDYGRVQQEQPLCTKMVVEYQRNNHHAGR